MAAQKTLYVDDAAADTPRRSFPSGCGSLVAEVKDITLDDDAAADTKSDKEGNGNRQSSIVRRESEIKN